MHVALDVARLKQSYQQFALPPFLGGMPPAKGPRSTAALALD
jgi:hypothetical protein